MGPKEKFHSESFASTSNLRQVLLHHYLAFLDKLRHHKKEIITERTVSSNVLCLESQLQKQNVEHAAILAYLAHPIVLTVETISSTVARHSSQRHYIKLLKVYY
jgi:hypothetical protein